MPEPHAIRLERVSKTYKLHASQRDQLVEVFGLQRFGVKLKTQTKEFRALTDVTLDVPRGHRIGIVGRNGAGKTTLLKMICGNFMPTSGRIEVNGIIQALMNVGLGFHPEFSGRENVESSLLYNGLSKENYEEAMQGIIEFCELGEFIDQPFKTYSMGMQARLMFAAATAIRPDILIVDEVLGAGDAYFIAKSKRRVESLIKSGCTMLLVSHSMQQVLELCNEAIWLHEGKIRMRDSAFAVVKAYEEFMHAPISKYSTPALEENHDESTDHPESEIAPADDGNVDESVMVGGQIKTENSRCFLLQEPAFLPHQDRPSFPDIDSPVAFRHLAPGGLSRWGATLPGELEFSGFAIVDARGEADELISLQPAKLILEVTVLKSGVYACRYNLNISSHEGKTLCGIKSPRDAFRANQGDVRRVEIIFNPMQLGPGEYTVGLALQAYEPIEIVNSAQRYDLLSRSFTFKVSIPSSWTPISNQFYHSAEWNFE